MTAKLPFTQASVVKRIRAAQKAGLRVTGIRSDGTVIVQGADEPMEALAPDATLAPGDASRWEDVEA